MTKPIILIYSPSLLADLVYREFINNHHDLIECAIELPYIPRSKTKKKKLLKEPILKKIFLGPAPSFLFFMGLVVTLHNVFSNLLKNSLSDLLKSKRVKVHRWHAIDKDLLKLLHEKQPDWIFNNSTSILRPNLINIPKFGVINYHGGKLPEFRSVACIFWMLIHNEQYVNGTLHYVSEGIDDGDIIDNGTKFSTNEGYSTFKLWTLIGASSYQSFKKLIPYIENREKCPAKQQNHNKANTYSFPTRKDINVLKSKGYSTFESRDILLFLKILFDKNVYKTTIIKRREKQ